MLERNDEEIIPEKRDARLEGFLGSDGEKVDPVGTASVQRDIRWLRSAFNIVHKEWH
jgi:hypothetical protein